jgi:transposase
MKRAADQIVGTDGGVMGERQGFRPPTETEGKQDLPAKARYRVKADTAAPGIGAILYVLRTGIHWKALPKTYRAVGSINAYFSEWAESRIFQANVVG